MKFFYFLALLFTTVVFACSCGNSGTPDKGAAPQGESSLSTDKSGNGPAAISDTGTAIFEPNPNAKADAFRLYYRERTERLLKCVNLFAMSGDVAWGNIINKNFVSKSGNDYEMIPGPVDNNAFGNTTFATWKLYQAMGGRSLELTLIRMFEGLAFNEAVTGHNGLTVREALPGWTRTVDGNAGTVTHSVFGRPVESPVEYPEDLEREIINTYYKGIKVTYRENPEDFFYNFKPVNELEDYSFTFVFDHLEDELTWIPISDCCSSFMKSRLGPWKGLGWWGNHNSRDNFTDYVMGYLAAFEAEKTPGLPADLALAAKHAADAARKVGDKTTLFGNILMTVDERFDYYTLSPAGTVGPDGQSVWQDLGSISSCQMAYLAKAISSDGLISPVPQVPLPGALEREYIEYLFKKIGIILPMKVQKCKCLDQAWMGFTFGDMLNLKIMGVTWYERLEKLTLIDPDIFYKLIGSAMDDFQELILGSVGLCYYAKITGDEALYREAYASLGNMIKIQTILAKLLYGVDRDASLKSKAVRKLGSIPYEEKLARAREMLYRGAIYERMFGFDSPLKDLDGFKPAESAIAWAESPVRWTDTPDDPLLTDEQIKARIEKWFPDKQKNEPVIYDRYVKRFVDKAGVHHPPVRRTAGGYEFIDQHDQWRAAENPHHRYYGWLHFWQESALAVWSPQTLDCSWAKLGCAPADFDSSGIVDSVDTSIFNSRWNAFGEGAVCNADNSGCNGADLDRDGLLDQDDIGFMQAAQGCSR